MNVAARQTLLDQEDDGWVGAILVEPLTALAGGIIGGVTVTLIAWRLAWRKRRTPLHVHVRRLMKAMH